MGMGPANENPQSPQIYEFYINNDSLLLSTYYVPGCALSTFRRHSPVLYEVLLCSHFTDMEAEAQLA